MKRQEKPKVILYMKRRDKVRWKEWTTETNL